jgi:hypothetical protein
MLIFMNDATEHVMAQEQKQATEVTEPMEEENLFRSLHLAAAIISISQR